METIKISIADDHALFRQGIVSLLAAQENFEVTGSFSNGNEVMKYLETEQQPDILLLDLTMPDMNGFEVLEQIKGQYQNVKCIALSMHDDGNYIVKCVQLGIYGYLYKNVDEEELIEAIHTVHNGGKYFNQDVSAKMTAVMALGIDSTKKLSPKETDVLNLLAQGKITKEIAEELFISTRTVESHRANMMNKLEVKNTAELIAKAAKMDLI